jgi:hypothetical protein
LAWTSIPPVIRNGDSSRAANQGANLPMPSDLTRKPLTVLPNGQDLLHYERLNRHYGGPLQFSNLLDETQHGSACGGNDLCQSCQFLSIDFLRDSAIPLTDPLKPRKGRRKPRWHRGAPGIITGDCVGRVFTADLR